MKGKNHFKAGCSSVSFVISSFFWTAVLFFQVVFTCNSFAAEDPKDIPLEAKKEQKLLDKHIEIDPVSDRKFAVIVEKTFDTLAINQEFEYQLPNRGQLGFPDWKSNYIGNEGDLNEIELLFEDRTDSGREGAEPFKIDIAMHFGGGDKGGGLRSYYYLIRHERGVENLVRLVAAQKRQKRFLLRSETGASLVAILPRLKKKGAVLMLCPRDIDVEKYQKGHKSLHNTPFEVTGVRFPVNTALPRNVEGRLQTGLGEGEALASIQTTGNVPASEPFMEGIVGDFPFVSVQYKPESPAVMIKDIDLDKGVTGGIRQEISLSNSLSQTGKIWIDYVLSLKRIQVNVNFMITYKKAELIVPPGICYVLVKEVRRGKYFHQGSVKRELDDDLSQMLKGAKEEKEKYKDKPEKKKEDPEPLAEDF